jgi:hypothetical protein
MCATSEAALSLRPELVPACLRTGTDPVSVTSFFKCKVLYKAQKDGHQTHVLTVHRHFCTRRSLRDHVITV